MNSRVWLVRSLTLALATPTWMSLAVAQSEPVTLPAYQPGNQVPALVLGGVTPPQSIPAGVLVTTQPPELQPPAIERRIEVKVPGPGSVENRVIEIPRADAKAGSRQIVIEVQRDGQRDGQRQTARS